MTENVSVGKEEKIPPKKQENTANVRMQKFLEYIEQHYSEDAALNDIAESAAPPDMPHPPVSDEPPKLLLLHTVILASCNPVSPAAKGIRLPVCPCQKCLMKFISGIAAKITDFQGCLTAFCDPAGFSAHTLIIRCQNKAFLIEILSGRGQTEGSVSAFQKGETKLTLQRLYLLRYGRLRNIVFFRRLGKAVVSDNGPENRRILCEKCLTRPSLLTSFSTCKESEKRVHYCDVIRIMKAANMIRQIIK